STTDEIKESPFINKTYDKDFPPSDLYMSDRFGGDIERLTQQPGFDGEGLFVQQPKDSFILFTSKRAELLGIYRLETKHAVISFLAASADKDRRSPTISPDHKQIAFIEKDKKTQEQSLQLYNLKTRKTEVMKSGEGLYRDLIFAPRSPDRVFYSVLRKGEKQYQIEMYDLAEKCTQVVFKGTDSLTSPVLSDDSIEKLAFARSFQEKKQIYIAPLPQNLGPCLENSKPVVK
ncbi:MAG TPA: hypothetical protein VN132_14780, partial [Bdellovibrio sp.]|nr:hypothetical protein [Bdellovibrio sp.]